MVHDQVNRGRTEDLEARRLLSDLSYTDLDLEIGAASDPPPEHLPPPAYQPSYGSSDAVPPSYSNTDTVTNDPPPSYDSLFGQVRSARQESSSIFEFFKKFLLIILSTVGCTIVVALVLAIPISMIVIGSMYLGQCPREHYIPIYLIVAGVFGILKNLSNVTQRVKNRLDEDDETENVAKTNPFDGTLNCFLFAWFIAGNVWIYRVYNDFNSEDPSSSEYCHPTLYWFAFWVTTATYIFGVTMCCCICCTGLIASCFTSSST
ncbi:hypothetical protein NP493_97g01033 [Ridgeia piscesae]|uniref:Uncharacterized protein n=1 Tax=Ridgeia piscesae TaxID=27915 RepID=A0AAD9UHQ6_RIDPI|nr:hypothetical protein NP493_97g01033 [Ridgeia piscesae]